MIAAAVRTSTRRPWLTILAWLAVAIPLTVLGGLASYSVTTDDTARFLPKGSESAQAVAFARDAFGVEEGTATVTLLARRSDGAPLIAGDRTAVTQIAGEMPRWRADTDDLDVEEEAIDRSGRAGHVVAATAGPLGDDGRFQLVALQWRANATDPVAQSAFRQFRDTFADRAADRGLTTAYTGGVASLSDQFEADETRGLIQGLALFAAVILLSALFLRGVLASILPLLTISLVAGAAGGLVVAAAAVFGFKLDVGTTQLISVVLIGVGVDYFLFLLFRLRERLRLGEDKRTAAASAAASVGPVIASAALVVIAAFATLALAQFGQFRILGPSIAISVAVMLLAGVTLMPAIAAVSGPELFWPSKGWRTERPGRAGRLGSWVAARPARAALVSGGVLVVLAAFALGTKSSYDLSSGGTDTAATRTADEIAAALPRGAADPQPVYVKASAPLIAAQLAPLRDRLASTPGVGSVSEPALTPDRRAAQLDLSLDAESTTQAAMDVVRGPVRSAARDAAPEGTTVYVAGTAAVFADVSDSVSRDLKLIFPVAAGLIFLILVATLRSALAPAYLLAAVALEFAATLGASVLVVQHLAGQPGIAFTLPLVVFLFVVAVGTDYNILMTARLREELRAGAPVHRAVAEAIRHTAPAIAAAGLVLASSFATLVLASDSGSREIGLALAIGILLASLVVSSVLVPALTALVSGQRAPRMRSASWSSKRASGSSSASPKRSRSRPMR